MAVTASGLFVTTFQLILDNTIAVDMSSETNIMCALISDAATPDFAAHDYWADLSASEVTGTNWAAKGVALTGTTWTSTGGALMWDAANVSVASTTLSNAMAAVIFDDSVSSPTADAMICLVDFTSPYSTSNGTFAITWSTSPNCIFSIDLTP